MPCVGQILKHRYALGKIGHSVSLLHVRKRETMWKQQVTHRETLLNICMREKQQNYLFSGKKLNEMEDDQ